MNAVLQSTELVVPEDRLAAEQLIKIGAITEEQALQGMRQAAAYGRSLEEHLFQTNVINRGDVLQLEQMRGLTSTVQRLAELPEWDVILNEPGQMVSAGSLRDTQIALLSSTKDRTKRFFMLVGEGVERSRAAHTLAKVIHTGHKLAATLQTSQHLLDLVYAEWDQRRKSGMDVREGESDLQKEFDRLGHEAFRLGASDIHISAARGKGAIHVRIHGELEHYRDITEEHATALCSVIYNTLVEEGSTKESFNPDKVQDAVIERVYPEGMIRFRYSGLPIAPSGFDVTLRVIPIGVATKRKTTEQLGYSPDQCVALDRMFSYSSGLILFAGTTGSGKSTTMANQLSWLAEQRPGKKIRTVEEPVEYKIEGAYQTPVKRINGDKSDFLVVLRQILRSDPDILGVGEIRDLDTAELAISGVRSGHMLVSTIHADGAPIIYDRLAGMGVGRYDLASVGLVLGLVYQKLVQVLCANCKLEACEVDAHGSHGGLLRRIAAVNGTLEGVYFRNPDGCGQCSGRGVTGRTVCAEILRPVPRMLKAIATGDSTEVWRLWRGTINRENPADMTGRTAFEHALFKMRNGLVCPESVEKEFHFLDEASYDEDLAP